jgi:tetratricopeptide (TPR) repeat protein
MGARYGVSVRGRPPSLLHALVAVSIATCLGCAGQEQHRRGRELMRAGEYDQAVEALREAVQRDRYNARYQVDLADAEAMAADENVADAERLLAENRATEAREELRLALNQMPGHPQAIVMMTSVETDIRRSAALTEQARAARAQGNYGEALQLLDDALRADANNSQAGYLRAQVVATGGIELPPDAPTLAVLPARQDADEEPVASEATAAVPVPADEGPLTAAPQRPDGPGPAPAVPGPPSDRPTAPGTHHPATRPAPAAPPGPAPAASTIGSIQQRVQVTLSRDDKRYPKELLVGDGIRIKLKKTRKNPLTADVEIRVEKMKKTYKRLHIGARVYGRGVSRQPYQFVVLSINDARETMHFVLEPLVQSDNE